MLLWISHSVAQDPVFPLPQPPMRLVDTVMKQDAGRLAATMTDETKGPDNYRVAHLHCPFENLTDPKRALGLSSIGTTKLTFDRLRGWPPANAAWGA